ncbi:DEAD/DEAH box helicase [Listeria sp. FSL L7-0091]|uniref:DEAD/DEAH box helicase n=1 Tax=Listeria farberi TaxID=2713500 RepID=A0A7X1DFU3_9LIST|nr:DEAD/DEAH box helicase [Listeria farberi]MBC1376740.1 DEAD/DEAH box helicase [Listeria farberi]MBC1382639.1 DEAD/DEAH box helicase [Listeria farberi]MBC2262297.1 DEAD/DEAH box helicase [Listeria farberi]MBC2268976.1 DEAD/DEAH box helicase [Listeria farberi]MBC2288741.1 DEAD/DEAH box helicase [Listeria farberi]
MTESNIPSFWAEKWKEHGYETPTEIQSAMYQPIKDGADVLAVSPTGTGKTVAYALPTLEKIEAIPKTQWLVLAPSHELVMQITEVIRSWLPSDELTVISLIGGANVKRQIEKLKKKPQIIVASPGRALELIKQKKIKMHEIKTITLDECDQLLRQENFKSTLEIVESAVRDRQLTLVSATKLENPEAFFLQTEKTPVMLEVTAKPEELTNVEHLYMDVESRDKATLLRRISHIKDMRGLVFVKDKPRMEILLEKLHYDKVKAAGIHGEIRKEKRKKYLDDFKKGTLTYLIVTDVAARGLDIEDLPYVIHYDLAASEKEYTHRSGRTGRMGKTGTVITFANPREIRTLKQYLTIHHLKGKQVRFYQGKLLDGAVPENKIAKKATRPPKQVQKGKKEETKKPFRKEKSTSSSKITRNNKPNKTNRKPNNFKKS